MHLVDRGLNHGNCNKSSKSVSEIVVDRRRICFTKISYKWILRSVALCQVRAKREDGFHMDLDDYLLGLLQMASELSRLAVNSVTAGDYGRPLRIAKFVAEMDSGFRLLNLKNDALRKRFDGLKYDLKKVEEVVYDLTIRGLKPAEETENK
ncbi:hypothetical protein FSP39_024875 [Pinctada imbricata]|uniref:Translin n=1 Tax=Pinctada imbricata TaxID=66713 RepID=A0AA88XNY7_PINIB|nr:hypothetical protein FSP39_024875 [Pinctada imbricata]